MLLSLTVFQQSVSEAMPITSLQIPLLGNLVVKLYTKNTKEIGRYNNHLIVHSRQNLFSTLYCIYRFVKKKLYIYKQPLQTSSKKGEMSLSPCHDWLVFSVLYRNISNKKYEIYMHKKLV